VRSFFYLQGDILLQFLWENTGWKPQGRPEAQKPGAAVTEK
jgi:hypothetical protein